MEFAQTKETAAQETLMNCGGDYEKALKRLEEIQEEILNQAHGVEGFEKYKELKQMVKEE